MTDKALRRSFFIIFLACRKEISFFAHTVYKICPNLDPYVFGYSICCYLGHLVCLICRYIFLQIGTYTTVIWTVLHILTQKKKSPIGMQKNEKQA